MVNLTQPNYTIGGEEKGVDKPSVIHYLFIMYSVASPGFGTTIAIAIIRIIASSGTPGK